MKNSKKVILFLILFIILISLIFIFINITNSKLKEYNKMFDEGIYLINNQKFNEALTIFEKMYNKGYKTNSVIKNCIFLYQITNQTNKLYIFIRTSIIDKGYNYKFKKHIEDLISEDYTKLLNLYFIDYFSDEVLFIFFIFSIIASLILLITIKNKKKLINLYFIIFLLNSLLLCLFFLKSNYYFHRNEAFVTDQVEIYNFPLPDSKPIFQLKDNIIVKLIKTFDNYSLIKLPNGKKGWIETKYLLKVFND